MSAIVNVAVAKLQSRSVMTGDVLPVLNSLPRTAEKVTSSGSSAQGTVTANAGELWDITVSGGPVFIAFGPSPDASVAATRFMLADGHNRQFNAMAAGEKYALMDAT